MKDLAAPRSTDGISYSKPSAAKRTRTANRIGNIPSNSSVYGPTVRYLCEPTGTTVRWEKSQRTTQPGSPLRNFSRAAQAASSWEISQRASRAEGQWEKYPSALLGSRDRWEISPRTIRVEGSMAEIPEHSSGRGLAARFPRGTRSRAQRSAHSIPEVGVFPSPGRRSPTGVSSGGQAANAQFTINHSQRRLTSRRDSGCLR